MLFYLVGRKCGGCKHTSYWCHLGYQCRLSSTLSMSSLENAVDVVFRVYTCFYIDVPNTFVVLNWMAVIHGDDEPTIRHCVTVTVWNSHCCLSVVPATVCSSSVEVAAQYLCLRGCVVVSCDRSVMVVLMFYGWNEKRSPIKLPSIVLLKHITPWRHQWRHDVTEAVFSQNHVKSSVV